MVWWAWIILAIACFAIEVHFTHDFSLFCVGLGAVIVAGLTLLTRTDPHGDRHHQRAFTMLAAQNVEIQLVVQTRGRAHVQSLLEALRGAGFQAEEE